MKRRLFPLRKWRGVVWLVPVLALVGVEVGRAIQVSQAIDRAAYQATRYAATGQFDSRYCPPGGSATQATCDSEAEEDSARLQSIYNLARTSVGASLTGDLRVVVCSGRSGYIFDEVNGVCRPHDDPGEPGESVIVRVGYNYPVGSILGASVGTLPLQSTYETTVERFRAVRLAGIPPTVEAPGVDTEIPVQDAGRAFERVQFAAPLPTTFAALPDDLDRKVIVNGDLQLAVADPDASLAQVRSLVEEMGGYVVNSEAWSDGEYRYAKAEVRVPADQFQPAIERLRRLALRVMRETITGEDVTEEYVDLESRLRSLRATADQLQALLQDAQTVDEALNVSAEMGRVGEQIEQVVGRMQYLDDRVALSTIAISLEPDRPTPTPTPVAWQPGTTAEHALNFLGMSVRFAGDVLIWAAIVGIPFAGVVWGYRRLRRRLRR